MLRARICFLAALFSWSVSVATAGDYIVPTGVTVLTEEQLLTRVIGNTLVGGTRWVEYYEPATGNLKEGRIKGKSKGIGLYGGSWKIKGALMCWEFDTAKMAVYNDCFTIALDGNTVITYTIHGKVHTDPSGQITLIPGNPNDL
jgi:hypothetical protein